MHIVYMLKKESLEPLSAFLMSPEEKRKTIFLCAVSLLLPLGLISGHIINSLREHTDIFIIPVQIFSLLLYRKYKHTHTNSH